MNAQRAPVPQADMQVTTTYSYNLEFANAKEADKSFKQEDEIPQAGTFTVKAQTNDSNYIAEIKKEAPAKQYEKYLAIRDKYKDVPVFYFTVATFFFEKGEREIALRILSNIAELDAENYELYKQLGYKLKEVKEFEPSLFAFKKVLDWRPMDPQSYRDYALALEDNGKHQQALDTLYTAITNNYAENISSMYHGIEETILPEMNRMIAVHKDKLNISRIPKKLVQTMPVDIRVVLNWNMNDTDIDLWVTDPNEEKCYYSHKATAIGGRISNDFTQGFGPEQFMLRKALKGKYKVEINYYGDRQAKIAGPTTVMAEVYTHYGSPNEKRQLITVQMKKDANGTVLIGEFEF
jgi:tetratricopeptide (TPR) repeat protein